MTCTCIDRFLSRLSFNISLLLESQSEQHSTSEKKHTETAVCLFLSFFLDVDAHLSEVDLLAVTFFDWLDAWMQLVSLFEGINVRVSGKHPCKLLSNVQFHEDSGPDCVRSLSVDSSLPLL